MVLLTVVPLLLSVFLPGPPSPEAIEPRVVPAHGDFIHPTAGVRFPEEAGGFVRTEVTQYDDEGRDLSATYRSRRSFAQFWATFYVYPVGSETRDLRERFEGARNAALERSGVTLTYERDIVLGDGRLSGRHAAFLVRQTTPAGESLYHSHLFLFRWEDWWVKWRFTFSATEGGAPDREVVELVEALTPSAALASTRRR